MANLNEDVRQIKGIGEKRAVSLSRLEIRDLQSLISFYPRRYDDRRETVMIEAAAIDAAVCITAMVATAPILSRVKRGIELVKLRVVDDTGALELVFFNQSYIKNALIPGDSYRFYGKISGAPSRKLMTNPIFEPAGAPGFATGRIVPVYRLAAGLSQGTIMKTVLQGLEACVDNFPNYLPKFVADEYKLAQSKYAYHNIHFPESMEALELARRRLIFEELFVLACALRILGGINRRREGKRLAVPELEEFYASLPYSPTGAQKCAVQDAMCDISSGLAMNRLIQGDVGSGKTLAAAACSWAVCKNGCQAAFMVPTEILAEQHYKTLCAFLRPFGINVTLLKGSMSAKQKREAAAAIKSGEAQLAVGTHALISEGVEFNNLALVITDEQHRFGVKQRSALSEKADSPHVLVMSATPIPRTLALMLYGDLDVSVIDELPPGRQKIDTFAVSEDYRPRINVFIEKIANGGQQIFVVCPMIEENEENPQNVRSAEEHAKYLSKELPDLRVLCVHGRMKEKEKDAVMTAFACGEADVLVSTTVIEVGVDVPNAALMVVENAERFGLSQLHQLRGRVGRGEHKSYCILVSDTSNPETKARLSALCKTNDGFKLAEEDLRLRGPGDFFGSRQHGLPEMRIADLCTDMNVLTDAQKAAEQILKLDPQLQNEANRALSQRLKQLFDLNRGTLN